MYLVRKRLRRDTLASLPDKIMKRVRGHGRGNWKHNQCTMIDPNIIVKDKLHPRTMVRSVGISPAAIPITHLSNSLIPHHYRMLVIDPTDGSDLGVGVFAGTDRNGLPFAGNIVEFDDPDLDGQGEWVVFLAKQTQQDQEVLDHNEGLPWVKNPGVPTFLPIPLPPFSGADSFVDQDGVFKFVFGGNATRATNWRKGSYGLLEFPFLGVKGVFFGEDSPSGIKAFECQHSVKWDGGLGRVLVGNKGITPDDVDDNSAVFIKSSANASTDEVNSFYVGFNFFPGLFPVSSNAIPYGPVETGERINTSTFDLDNMTRTADGSISWFSSKSEQFRPIQSIAMWFELIDTFTGSDSIQSKGDYEIGIFLIDSRDNTRILSFTQGKNRDLIPQEGKLPGEFYSGVPGASSFFNARQPEPTDAFDRNNILFGGIYTKDSFDSQGRYQSGHPINVLFQFLGTLNRFVAASELEMTIDAFRMTKALYVTNVDEPNNLPSKNIDMVDQKKTDITNYSTAKNLILGLTRLFGFRQQRFDIDIGGRCDIAHGDPIYYTDTEQVDETTDSLPNTLKMVNDRMTYKLVKTTDGPAGFTAKISPTTRLWPDE